MCKGRRRSVPSGIPVLVLTFGFVLLTTDVAIGRKTKKNALRAFEELNPKWKFLGRLTFLVPVLIMTYYSVIGGWISKIPFRLSCF